MKWASYFFFLIVGLALLYAGYLKIADTEKFLSSLLTYELFPLRLASLLAVYLPWLEALVGACLATGILRKGGVLLAWLLLMAFLAAISQAWLRGLAIDCGCFGASKVSSNASDYLALLGRDLALLVCLWLGSKLSAADSRRTHLA